MRFNSFAPLSLAIVAALGCALACGDDDDDAPAGAAGSSMTEAGAGGSGTSGSTSAGGEGGGAATGQSQLCTDLGGPANIDAVVRGDGKVDAEDPFNGFKFEKDGRQASVLLNVATDPCIGAQFAHLLDPAKAKELEHLAQCLSLFVQSAAGCAVDYATATDSEGEECLSMKKAHTGLGITEEDYTALVMDAATALIAAGVPADSPQFAAVAGALTSDELKADVIESDDASYSQPGAMCVAAGGAGAGGEGGAP